MRRTSPLRTTCLGLLALLATGLTGCLTVKANGGIAPNVDGAGEAAVVNAHADMVLVLPSTMAGYGLSLRHTSRLRTGLGLEYVFVLWNPTGRLETLPRRGVFLTARPGVHALQLNHDGTTPLSLATPYLEIGAAFMLHRTADIDAPPHELPPIVAPFLATVNVDASVEYDPRPLGPGRPIFTVTAGFGL